MLAAASLRSRIATGPHRGAPWRRLGDRVEPRETADEDPDALARVPQHGGMSLHADVAVPAQDRRRLERLCRYVARPPLGNERLEERTDGTLALRFKTRWRDGTTHILMERNELIERLVPLIPPPRAHQVRYHGILAPGASQRDRVVPRESAHAAGGELSGHGGEGSPEGREAPRQRDSEPSDPCARSEAPIASPPLERDREEYQRPLDPRAPARRMRWAALLQRVFEVDALRCPRCGSAMRLIAVIEDPVVARRLLECLELPARAPPLRCATASSDPAERSKEDWFFDPSSAHEEA